MAEAQQDAARTEPVGYLLTTASGEDQVVRRIRFSEAHPHVHIERKTAPGVHWEASWVAGGEPVTVTDVELEKLLDSLEARQG
jgi:hypothetical protein